MKTQLLTLAFLVLSAFTFAQNVGDTAPDFTLTDTNGDEFTLSAHQGKVVAVFLFGYSCSSCAAIAPSVQSKLADAFGSNENFEIIGVDTWNGSQAQVQNFKSNSSLSFRVMQQGSTMANSWGTTYDRIVVVDQEGKLGFKHGGLASTHIDKAVEYIQGALNDTQTSAEDLKKSELAIYPNPVNEIANVRFNLETQEKVSISVYNITGMKVMDIDHSSSIGLNTVSFDTNRLNSGINFIHIQSKSISETLRFTVQ